MSDPPLTPLTSREQAVADFFRQERVTDLCVMVTAAAIGVGGGAFVHDYCRPGDGPAATTAGGDYCASVPESHTWALFGGAALIVVLVLRFVLRGRSAPRRVALAILVIAVVVNAVVLLSLSRCGPVTCTQ